MLCCTISNDRSVKIYDVVNYDMMAMIRLSFLPGSVEWVYKQGDVKAKLAISDRNSPFVHIYDARSGSNDPIQSREVLYHRGNIKLRAVSSFIPLEYYETYSDTSISHFYSDTLSPS